MSLDHAASAEAPMVSVVVPMLNESSFIGECLAGFAEQDYPSNRFEVLIVDGGSIDGSRELVETLAAKYSWIRIVENRARKAAAAFNRGVAAARGEVVCLFSAHGIPDVRYLSASVAALYETGAVGVGGRYLHVGLDPASNAIGAAMVSPFGMASPHRFASSRGDVDTISHPAYWRDALIECGEFDETLERNSDYELNHRLRRRGGRLLFDPSIVSTYRPRGSLRHLARQFWWYGRWKVRVIEQQPESLKIRHVVAPMAVLAAVLSPAVALAPRGRKAVAIGAFAYAVAVGGAVVHARPREHGANPFVLAAAFPVMHVSWGAGFLASVFDDSVMRRWHNAKSV